MSEKVFQNITGMWKRKKTVNIGGKQHVEDVFYGQITGNKSITLNPGDQVYLFQTRGKLKSHKQPSFHLKKKEKDA